MRVAQRKSAGAIIKVSRSLGDTSGRITAAEIIARVFPEYKQFVIDVAQMVDSSANRWRFGPYPNDKLTYRSKKIVEFETPPNTDGLGTYSRLEKNEDLITGAAILDDRASGPDVLLLAVRLPPDRRHLTPAIIRQFENDATRLAK